MMKKLYFLFFACLLFSACEKPNNDSDNDNEYASAADVIRNAVKDIDGNVYDAVRIGNQVWMASNLKTTRFADGSKIQMGDVGLPVYTTPYRYHPGNNSKTVSYYGYLYNWPAVMHGQSSSDANLSGVQGICPDGWHVPSVAEWIELFDYVAEHKLQYGNSLTKALS